MVCKFCGLTLESTKKKFCSHTCSAKFNNPLRPPKSKERICSRCANSYTYSSTHRSKKFCAQCSNTKKYEFKSVLLSEYHKKYKNKHPSWRNSEIRQFNRRWNHHLLKKPCVLCGYSIHVELCHIKAVSEFDPITTTLGEANHESNIVPLCRNCHWEFDHGLVGITHSLGTL